MLDRQTTWIEEDETDGEENDEDDLDHPSSDMSGTSDGLNQRVIAGFCGRCGKIADTCYCFWNVGALAVSVSTKAPFWLLTLSRSSSSISWSRSIP